MSKLHLCSIMCIHHLTLSGNAIVETIRLPSSPRMRACVITSVRTTICSAAAATLARRITPALPTFTKRSPPFSSILLRMPPPQMRRSPFRLPLLPVRSLLLLLGQHLSPRVNRLPWPFLSLSPRRASPAQLLSLRSTRLPPALLQNLRCTRRRQRMLFRLRQQAARHLPVMSHSTRLPWRPRRRRHMATLPFRPRYQAPTRPLVASRRSPSADWRSLRL